MLNLFEYKNNFEIAKDKESRLFYGNYDDCPNPKVSIVIPIYKNLFYFKIALQSALNQDCDFEYEIVVLDDFTYDGKPDEEQQYIESVGAKNVFYYRNIQNLGMSANWNRCFEKARAPFFTYLHNDDELMPNCLSTLMSIQEKTGDKVIACNHNLINNAGEIIRPASSYTKRFLGMINMNPYRSYSKFDVFMDSPGVGVGCLFKRDIMIELGGYNHDYYPAADYAIFAKYIFKYGGVWSNIPTYSYRIGENDSTTTYPQFSERDKFFRECMRDKMQLPNFLLNLLISSLYKNGKVYFAVFWGHQDPSLYGTISFKDKLFLKMARFIQRKIHLVKNFLI